jgi:hypothetical protein
MRQLIGELFNITGSQVSLKILGRSLRNILKNKGLSTHPCLTPTEELKESVRLLAHFTENDTEEYIF